MENASKALLMAGAVLIGVLLLAIMVYLFSSAYSMREAYSSNVNTTRMNEFNTKFTKYAITEEMYNASGGSNYVTIRNIVTLANYAKEFNNGMSVLSSDYIAVCIDIDDLSGNNISRNNKLLKENINKIYVVDKVSPIEYNANTGRIKLIRFTCIGEKN